MIALGSLSFSYSVDSLEFDPASIFDSQFRFKEIIQGFLSVLVLAFLARGFRKSANFPGILQNSKVAVRSSLR